MTDSFRLLTFSCAFIVLALFGACSDDEATDENIPTLDNGTATVSITGSVESDLDGIAGFRHEIIQAEPVEGSQLQIVLINEENPEEVVSLEVTVRGDFDGVDPGTYAVNVSSTDDAFVNMYYTTENDLDFIATNTGQITIDGINDDAVWGSFSGKLVEIQNSTIEVSGQFNAEPL